MRSLRAGNADDEAVSRQQAVIRPEHRRPQPAEALDDVVFAMSL